MKVKLKYTSFAETIVKSMVGISEIEVRQGHLEFWIRDEQNSPILELSIKLECVISMVCFKHIPEKNMRKVKERKSRVKKNLRVKRF